MQGSADEVLAEVEAAAHQVFLARKFYNDVVAATREARHRPPRPGPAPVRPGQSPEFFEMDDSLVAENTRRPARPLAAWPYDDGKQ